MCTISRLNTPLRLLNVAMDVIIQETRELFASASIITDRSFNSYASHETDKRELSTIDSKNHIQNKYVGSFNSVAFAFGNPFRTPA